MKGILFPAALLLTLLAFVKAEACTTAVIPASASRTGRPLLWKQRDTSEEANHLAHFRGERYAFTGLVDTADTLLESVWCGANEAGFAIANNVSYNLRPDSLENKPYEGLVMKRALGCCATVDDFERMLREMPHPNGLETNYGVIDAAGGAAYFEVWDYGYTRYDAADTPEGYLWRTNFSLSGRPDEGRGYTRYATAEETMAAEAAEKFSPEWLLDFLGRSFRNAVLGTDLMQEPLPASGLVLDVDYIPRYTTTASIVIEGVAAGEAPNSAVLWCAPGLHALLLRHSRLGGRRRPDPRHPDASRRESRSDRSGREGQEVRKGRDNRSRREEGPGQRHGAAAPTEPLPARPRRRARLSRHAAAAGGHSPGGPACRGPRIRGGEGVGPEIAPHGIRSRSGRGLQ